MLNASDLAHGIEYIYGRVSITCLADGKDLELKLTPDWPASNHPVKLLCEHSLQGIEFVDLTGNGYGTPNHGKGYGRLLVNTAVQCLHLLYGRDSDIPVRGYRSNAGDPEGEAGIECTLNRSRFWQDSGFNVRNPEATHENMSSILSDMIVRDSAIPITEFWPIGSRPALLPTDYSFLATADAADFTLKKVASQGEINALARAAQVYSDTFRYVLWALLSAGTYNLLSSSDFSSLQVVALTVLLSVAEGLFLIYVFSYIDPKLPTSKKLTNKFNDRIKQRLVVHEKALLINRDHPGIFNRLYLALKDSGHDTSELTEPGEQPDLSTIDTIEALIIDSQTRLGS